MTAQGGGTGGPRPGTGGAPGGAGGFLWRHRTGVLRALGALLLGTVILQNVEPTTIDLLFWSLPGVPKLVLILISMALGAGLWEIVRRAW